MIDYIVVGVGLAGIAFCEQLEKNNKTFVVFDDGSQKSSNVAGGMYNPVILKRFTGVWKAKEQIGMLTPFYEQLEHKLEAKVDFKMPVLRRFVSIEEQNMWFEASDKPALQPFLSTKLHKNSNKNIDAPFGYGEVLHTGRVATDVLQKKYVEYLSSEKKIVNERFDYDSLLVEENHIAYKEVKAKNIVFCEGFGLKKNPFFNYLPLVGTKGELLEIECKDLHLDFVLKSSVFMIPLGENCFKVGATYKWKDKTDTPTEESRLEMEKKLQSFLKCDYTVINHFAGIRPTVTDRKPLVGTHPKHNRLHVLNGLGSRGVMIAPYAAEKLYQSIEKQIPLEKEMDVIRFEKKYPNPFVSK
ncbi:NAD(P)/FAD-dependent oxidoreductase [Galbibacter mesophilus]|uniref:NAD(P)/FAD-dependent oxidoreductase n=1 Tax=Galbibacter mesophilus TaxID=379069 RepID=UPI00191DA2E0|nr:FAD-binding oxidoreductase [Galbibacter mesophilus]MCM5662711.1 FAD-binding oxidoreductase [Galbibacter mesophilus]